METEATRQANNVIPPVSSATPGTGVTCITTAVTASVVDLYTLVSAEARPMLYERYWSLMADGGDVYFLFSASSVTIDKTAGSTTFDAATTAVTPWLLKDGVEKAFRLNDTTIRYLCLQASSGTPKLRLVPSSQPAFTASLRH